MNKEEWDKYLSRANQDIQYCQEYHTLKEYIAGLLENNDYFQQENKQLKEEISKISKKEIKVRDMLYSIENGILTRERLMQIEEVLFEIGDSNE